MKKLILIALVAVSAVACQKEQTQTKKSKIPIHDVDVSLPCVDLNKDRFLGVWKYIHSQNANGQAPVLNGEDIFQTIRITPNVVSYIDIPELVFRWVDLGCSVVRGINQPEDLLIIFPPNDDRHMYWKGLITGTTWYLEKQFK